MDDYVKGRIDALEEYIRYSLERTTTGAVQGQAFYSYRHANRLFKSVKGESINAYSNKIRIQTAAELLKYSKESIFDIALIVGYESTAAFSKAFKKGYGQTPSSFRAENNLRAIFQDHREPDYEIKHLVEKTVYLQKIEIPVDISFTDLYLKTKRIVQANSIKQEEWMILWDEDPMLSQVADSRFFLAIPKDRARDATLFSPVLLKGRYAIFPAAAFGDLPYHLWHELVSVVLNLDGHTFRDSLYIEWFSPEALDDLKSFLPNKIGVAIE